MTRKNVTAKSLLSRRHLRSRTFRRAVQRSFKKDIVASKKRRLAEETQDSTN